MSKNKFFVGTPLCIFIYIFISTSLIFAQASPNWIELKSDTNTYSVPSISKPGYLESYTDPVFGTKVTRITGDQGSPIITKDGQTIGTWGEVVKHHYSKDQPWNADGSLIHIVRNNGGSPSSLFLDGETYEVLFARSVPGQDNRWHPVDPDLKIFVSGNRIGYFNVHTGSAQILHTFSDYSRIDIGPYEANFSRDGRQVVLYGDSNWVFAYDLSIDKVYPRKQASSIDWAGISPLGNYVVIMYNDTNTQVFDLNMNFISQFTTNQNHYDMGLDLNGDEVAVGLSKSSEYSGKIIYHRLRDAQFRVLTTGGYGIHTSMRSNLSGWAFSAMHAVTRYPPYNGEALAIRTDGNLVYRLAHMHNNQVNYDSEAFPVVSVEGGRVMFGSNWGESDGYPVSTYVVDFRSSSETSPPATPGDANGDGRVDGIDYVIWLSHYNQNTSAGSSEGDFNSDGKVDGVDYVVWLQNYQG